MKKQVTPSDLRSQNQYVEPGVSYDLFRKQQKHVQMKETDDSYILMVDLKDHKKIRPFMKYLYENFDHGSKGEIRKAEDGHLCR
jgi:hypothetical protein